MWPKITLSIIIFLLAIPVVIMLCFSAPICLLFFIIAAVPLVLLGKSRTVTDPIYGITEPTTLSPNQFHIWADTVVSSRKYKRLYDIFVLDSERGFDEKLPLVFGQIKAINYMYAYKILLILLIGLNAFCVYDLFYSDLTFSLPTVMGLVIGTIWGYALGIFLLWRVCWKTKGPAPFTS